MAAKTFAYNGTTYVTGEIRDGCRSCAFSRDKKGCDISVITKGCSGVIWVKKEEVNHTNTTEMAIVEKVARIAAKLTSVEVNTMLKLVKEEYTKQLDPQYQEYLRLKEIYESK